MYQRLLDEAPGPRQTTPCRPEPDQVLEMAWCGPHQNGARVTTKVERTAPPFDHGMSIPLSKSGSHRTDHSARAFLRILVLPDPDHRPTRLGEPVVRLLIPFSVPSYLFRPIFGIGLRHGVVFRASMPKAPVHEDRDFRAREHQVGGPSKIRKGSDGDAIPETRGVDTASYLPLRTGVPALVGPHALADARVRRPGRPLYDHGTIIGRKENGHSLGRDAHLRRFRERDVPEPGARTPEVTGGRGGFIARVDLRWEELGVIGETDGIGPHSPPRGPARDRLRQNAPRTRHPSTRVVRFTWADLGRPEYVLATVSRERW